MARTYQPGDVLQDPATGDTYVRTTATTGPHWRVVAADGTPYTATDADLPEGAFRLVDRRKKRKNK